MKFITYLGNGDWRSEDGWKIEVKPYIDLHNNHIWLFVPDQNHYETGVGYLHEEEMWYQVEELFDKYPTTYNLVADEPPSGLASIDDQLQIDPVITPAKE